jgi:C1A family cysteine protease
MTSPSKRTLPLLAALALAGCGGGGGGDSSSPPPAAAPPPPETLFVPGNAWNGSAPADSESVAPDEFRRRQVAGDLQVVTPTTQQTQRTARQRHIESERDFLESKTDTSDEVKAVLAQSRASADIESEPVATLPDGRQVVLLGAGSRIESAAESYRLAHDPANALASYELSYALLPDELKAQVPAPDTLRGGTIEQINQAKQQMDTALQSVIDLDKTRIDPEVPPPPAGESKTDLASALGPGNGADNLGACAPTGYVKRFWFPLRSFVSPIKSQGERGTCWAFAAIASVESRERVQNNNAADLSEQFLVNKYKHEWLEDDFTDGGSAASALNGAVTLNQPLMPEAGWTYNGASGRPDNAFDADIVGTPASYSGACTDSNGVRYTGPCSETSHESHQSCTSFLGSLFCGYDKTTFNGPGVASSRERLIWSSGETFDLEQYRALLANGVSMIASFPVYEGFVSAPDGIVSDYRKQMKNKKGDLVDGAYGGHLVQIVGFISNEQLSFPGFAPSAVGGGGYFIIRNSWGCAGDGGYYYVPADYVSGAFATLEVLDFSAARSTRWNDEQVTPGGTAGLAIDGKGSAAVDLRVQSNLASQIAVSHPTANYVRLTVTSNVDGVVYDGQWLVNAPVGGSLFANSLPVNFQTEGLRTLTMTARYGSQAVSATKSILVLNSAPAIAFQSSGTPQQNENFVINAVVTDKNEVNPTAMCRAMTWSVNPPDTIVSGSDCTRVVRFGATGQREVRVGTRDAEGLQAAAIGTFAVAPPPANPFPRVATFGVFARNDQLVGGQVTGCRTDAVANNAVIDLRQLGCKPFGVNVPDRPRYFLQLGIENPAAETLSYDWTYTDFFPNAGAPPRVVTSHTTTPTYDMDGFLFGVAGEAGVSTHACTVEARVNAPEASRSKSLRIWSGQCINVNTVPH